jgi:hypothetical protein
MVSISVRVLLFNIVQYCDVTNVMIIHKKIKLDLDWYKQYMKVMKFNHPSILKATLLEPNTEISPFQLCTYFNFCLLNPPGITYYSHFLFLNSRERKH